jgi:hypothetical protein
MLHGVSGVGQYATGLARQKELKSRQDLDGLGETPDRPAQASLSNMAVLAHRTAARVGGRGGQSRATEGTRPPSSGKSRFGRPTAKSWQSGPPLTTRSTPTASMSAPGPSPVGRHWNVCPSARMSTRGVRRWRDGVAPGKTYGFRGRRSTGLNSPETTEKPPFSSATHKKSRPTNGTRLGQSCHILGGLIC